MKKFLSVLLVCTALSTALVSCTTRTDPPPTETDSHEMQGESQSPAIGALPEGMSGTEAARLLLAEERLNAQLLRKFFLCKSLQLTIIGYFEADLFIFLLKFLIHWTPLLSYILQD